jgi:hypothetical protein
MHLENVARLLNNRRFVETAMNALNNAGGNTECSAARATHS